MHPLDRLEDARRRLAELTRDRPRTGRTHDDADDDAGTVETDAAIGFDPVPLLRALDRHGARVCVIGQVAGILHGSAELTGDLDLLWDGDPAQAPALAAAFAAAGVTLTDDDGVPVGPEGLALPKVQFTGPAASGDCCTPALPWGELPVAAFLDRCETVHCETDGAEADRDRGETDRAETDRAETDRAETDRAETDRAETVRDRTAAGPDWTLRYLRRADLIAMRRAVGRPKDLRRAAELETLRP